MVQIGSEEYATMDNYTTELNVEEDITEDDLWADEDQVNLTDVPEALWSEAPFDKLPPAPAGWIDQLADKVETGRLLSMKVLEKRSNSSAVPEGTLTTRFVYDSRKKLHKSGTERWMRRSRFVGGEFASEKRTDTYAPANSCHTANLFPLIYLKMSNGGLGEAKSNDAYKVTLAALDIKEAFLQVLQSWIIGVTTVQHRIRGSSQFAGTALRCACLVLALWELCVGDFRLLLVQGTTLSWKVHNEWCAQHFHDPRRRPRVCWKL